MSTRIGIMRREVIVKPREGEKRVLSYHCLEQRVGSRKGCNTGQKETLFVRANERGSAPTTPEQSGRNGRARIDGLIGRTCHACFHHSQVGTDRSHSRATYTS